MITYLRRPPIVMMLGVLFRHFCFWLYKNFCIILCQDYFLPGFFRWSDPSSYGILLPVQQSGQQWKKLDRSYPSIKHKQKWVWGDRSWEHFPSAGRKTCIWKVSVYSQLGDRHRNIVSVGLLLEQGTPWTGLSGAVKGGHHQYCKSTWSTQLICNIVNETDNPAGNLPDCTKCQWHKT